MLTIRSLYAHFLADYGQTIANRLNNEVSKVVLVIEGLSLTGTAGMARDVPISGWDRRVGAASNPFWFLLALVFSAAWLHCFLQERTTRRARILGLLTAVGLFAFAFSIFSPDDDLVQPEFVQSHRAVARNSRKAERSGNETRVAAADWTPQATGPKPSPSVIVRIRLMESLSPEVPFAHPPADRAPPVLSCIEAA